MTTKSWQEEFCPVDPNHVKTQDMGAWILRKWEGLREGKLEEHGMLQREDGHIEDADGNKYSIDATSCPWCLVARNRFEHEHIGVVDQLVCPYCPAVVAGMRSCVRDTNDMSSSISPYGLWMDMGVVEPMIKWIKDAIALINKKEAT